MKLLVKCLFSAAFHDNLLMGPPSNVFFSTSAYFVNGNTWLMFDLTDN